MLFKDAITDTALLHELGNRLKLMRLNDNISLEELASAAGVSPRTIQRMEHGESLQMVSFIRILRKLKLLDRLDVLIPEPLISPIQLSKLRGKQRKRASSSRSKPSQKTNWTWGDES